ncbi:MAG: hypothetical protein AzoDbin1_05351 [Azoarcus sp.]|nr:hypothetical protein [Azoarcus sp.]
MVEYACCAHIVRHIAERKNKQAEKPARQNDEDHG